MARKWWTLLAVSVGTFMLLLDITVVNTALPSIEKDLSASFTDVQWVIDAYTLSLAAVVLTAGSLADRLGRRAVFAIGLGDLLGGLAGGGPRTRRDVPEHLARRFRESAAPRCSRSRWRWSRRSSRPDGSARRRWASTARRSASRSRSGRSSAARSPSGSAGDGCSSSTCRSALLAIAVTFCEDPRVPRSERDPNRLARARQLQQRAGDARAGATAWQRRRLGKPADRRPVRRRRGDAGRVHGDRAPRAGADAPARAVPPARVHRRPARGGRGVGLAVRAVPVPDAVPAELPRLLAAAGGAPLPADHAGAVPGRAARGRADGAGSARGS